MSASSIRLMVLYPGKRRTKENAGTADAAGIFNSLALEGLEASDSILSVCCFVSIP